MKQKLIILVSIFFFILNSEAQILDPSFGNGGKLVLDGVIGFQATVVQPDGKIIVAGSTTDGLNIIVCRLNNDGSFDNSFGNNGKKVLSFNTGALDVDIQTDGKIIVAGTTAVARLNPDGTPDMSFNINGVVNVDFSIVKLLIQSDGKIVLAGNATPSIALIRLNSNGSPDANFGTAGKVILPSFSPLLNDSSPLGDIVQQSDNKIVITGFCLNASTYDLDFYVVRFNQNGTLDNSFAGVGYRFVDINNNINIASSILTSFGNKTTVTGTGLGDFQAFRLNEDGSFDNSFNGTGKFSSTINNNYSWPLASAFQVDGKLLLAGYVYNQTTFDFGIMRLNTDGTLDNSFNGTGSMSIDFNNSNDRAGNVVALEEGKILLTGNTDVNGGSELALARLLTIQHTYYRDADVDGYGNNAVTTSYYFPPEGYVVDNTDCNDNDASIYPAAPELCDGKDNDCDGVIDESCVLPDVTINDATVYESQGTATLTVSLSYATNKDVTVSYRTADGTAKSNGSPASRDFSKSSGHLTFAAGTTSQTITISINQDNNTEQDEYLDVELTRAVNATIAGGSGRVTIIDGSPTTQAKNVNREKENAGVFSIRSFPNPSSNFFTFTLSSNNYSNKILLRVIDINGRIVEIKNNLTPGQTFKLGENYQPGFYLVEVIQGNERRTLKLIKQAN